MAMEDSIVLARLLATETEQDTALQKYQDQRMTEALRLQNAARNSMEWFENVKRYHTIEARTIRLQPSDPQPASQSRKSAPSRPWLYFAV